ncbi:unnamed protein product [Durusdinium trenchii]
MARIVRAMDVRASFWPVLEAGKYLPRENITTGRLHRAGCGGFGRASLSSEWANTLTRACVALATFSRAAGIVRERGGRPRGRVTTRGTRIFVPAKAVDEVVKEEQWKSIEVEHLGDKGFGMVAARPIRRGELVLREAPLLGLPESFDGDLEELMNQTSLRQLDADLRQALEDLSEEQQRRFWSLADSHSPGQKTAAGVALTNALQLGTGGGLLCRSARFNHSCLPNVQGTWADGCAEWRALRDVSAGEELCFSYVDPYQTDVQRQETLELLFKFKCQCPVCSLEREARETSNQTRLQLRELNEGLQLAVIGADDAGYVAERLVPEMLDLLDIELGGSSALKTKALHLGFLLALESEDEDLAKNMAQKAYEHASVAYGPNSDRAKMLQACAEGDYESEEFEDMLLEMQSEAFAS